jgi:hypothetical protein
MQYPNLVEVSWHRGMLPNFLWLSLMLGRRGDFRTIRHALAVLEAFVDDEAEIVLDGRMTSFDAVPESRRAEARDRLQREVPQATPEHFGHVLGLFKDAPGSWLYEGRAELANPDTARALALLRSIVGDLRDKQGRAATQVRVAAYVRWLLAGKTTVQRGSVFELLVRYPRGVSSEERGMVESAVRAAWMALGASGAMDAETERQWSTSFWAQCRKLTPCRARPRKDDLVMAEAQEDGPLDPEPAVQASEMRRLLESLETLGDALWNVQLGLTRDPNEDERPAVLLGLASRMYRQMADFLERPSAWAHGTSELHTRPLVETRIVSAWLVKRDDPTIFAGYIEHGLGKLKLLRDHINNDVGPNPDPEVAEMLKALDARVNVERDEWFQPVNVGAFSDVSIRRMAEEVNLKREYDLAYAPLSSSNHGEWAAVRDDDTVLCEEVLHGGHRVGRFEASSRTLGPEPAMFAFSLARDGITAIFEHLGADVAAQFEPVAHALTAALYEHDD